MQKIFNLHIKAKVGCSKRLLIVNEHLSYMNIAFLDWADWHVIIVAVMLSYSTYQLQLLDISLFSLLSTASTKQLNNFMFNSLRIVLITKRFFYLLFQAAFNKAFT